jgi:hypothetical protein
VAQTSTVKTYVATNDPSLFGITGPITCFIANSEVFTGGMKLENISDGTSNTLFFAEGYSNCNASGDPPVAWYRSGSWNMLPEWTWFIPASALGYTSTYFGPTFGLWKTPYQPAPTTNYNVFPFVTTTPPLMQPYPFQVRPNPNNNTCEPLVPQGLSSGGLQVLLGDGSVRMCNPNISLTTWQAAQTPTAGDVLGSDW